MLNSWKAEDISRSKKLISSRLRNMQNVKASYDSFRKSNCDIAEITIHANHFAPHKYNKYSFLFLNNKYIVLSSSGRKILKKELISHRNKWNSIRIHSENRVETSTYLNNNPISA